MTARLLAAALCCTAAALPAGQASLEWDLDRIFDDPALARALVAVRVESLGRGGTPDPGHLIYARNADRLVMPASNMKLLTIAAAADTLGWSYRFDTRLEAAGTVADGVLSGDLVVVGSGDPSIGSPDGGHAPVFLDWASALLASGIRRVNGRIVGDDNAWSDETRGAGWAWDYLGAGYAAPIGALNYNENAAMARFTPDPAPGRAASVSFGPPGHGLELSAAVVTGERGSRVSLEVFRAPRTPDVVMRGSIPAGGSAVARGAAVENPTRYFVEALRLALESRGIGVSGGAWDVDELETPPPPPPRRSILVHQSEPLSALAGYAMKVSQNMYAEALLRALGGTTDAPATVAAGRRVAARVLGTWGLPPDAVVMYDGSGLSRYNYVTANAVVTVLKHVWDDERLRGRFVADLPLAGHDGTLELRMRNTRLTGRVQAKTGTISNARALSGYLLRLDGGRLVFSIIVNHFTAPTDAVDAIVEKALERLLDAN